MAATNQYEDGEWIQVTNNRRRNRKREVGSRAPSMHKTRGRNYPTDLDRTMAASATTFFFTRFPDSWDQRDLWEMFGLYGKIVDLFVSNKRTKLGTRFGFVRFRNTDNIAYLEKRLSEIRFGNSRLVFNIAKYGKGDKKVDDRKKVNTHLLRSTVKDNPLNGNTFLEVVTGKRSSDTRHNKKTGGEDDNTIELSLNESIQGLLKCCLFGQVKSYEILGNIRSIFNANGLGECCIHYTGGLSVLLEWATPYAAKEVLECSEPLLLQWFEYVKLWNGDVINTDRLVWLRLEGIPIQAWGKETVEKVAGVCGRVLEVEERNMDSSKLHYIYALVLTNNMTTIDTVLNAKLNNHRFQIRVTEDSYRTNLSMPELCKKGDRDENDDASGVPMNEDNDQLDYEDEDEDIFETQDDDPLFSDVPENSIYGDDFNSKVDNSDTVDDTIVENSLSPRSVGNEDNNMVNMSKEQSMEENVGNMYNVGSRIIDNSNGSEIKSCEINTGFGLTAEVQHDHVINSCPTRPSQAPVPNSSDTPIYKSVPLAHDVTVDGCWRKQFNNPCSTLPKQMKIGGTWSYHTLREKGNKNGNTKKAARKRNKVVFKIGNNTLPNNLDASSSSTSESERVIKIGKELGLNYPDHTRDGSVAVEEECSS